MNAENRLDKNEIDQAAGKVLSLISEPFWNPRRPRSPEKRRLLTRLHAAILEAHYFEKLPEDARTEAQELLNTVEEGSSLKSRAAVAELVDRWDQLLIAHGQKSFVRGVLATEYVRDGKRQVPLRWRDVFGKRLSEGDAKGAWSALVAGKELDDEEAAVRRMLRELYATRAEQYAFDRARMMTKAFYLLGLVPALLLLVVGLAVVIGLVEKDGPSVLTILVAAFAGALGAAVSGTFKLRDQISRISQVRAFLPAMGVQLLLGAVAGLFLLAVLQSGVIEIGWDGPVWAESAVFAFVAGFSEPFFIGIVSRVAAIDEEAEKQKEPAQI